MPPLCEFHLLSVPPPCEFHPLGVPLFRELHLLRVPRPCEFHLLRVPPPCEFHLLGILFHSKGSRCHKPALPQLKYDKLHAFNAWVHTSIYIYILAWDLCIYMHRESESDVKVDPIVTWIWSKV